jgi:hypothetical protein
VIHKNAAVSHIANETLSAKGFPGFAWAEGTMPTVLVHGRVQQHGYPVTTKITNSDGCRVWKVIEREDTLVAAAGFEPAVLPRRMRQ